MICVVETIELEHIELEHMVRDLNAFDIDC